jgi:hypothetical protein
MFGVGNRSHRQEISQIVRVSILNSQMKSKTLPIASHPDTMEALDYAAFCTPITCGDAKGCWWHIALAAMTAISVEASVSRHDLLPPRVAQSCHVHDRFDCPHGPVALR